MQHQPFEVGHVGKRDRCCRIVMGERAEHPADGVAQLLVGLAGVLDDLGPETNVAGSIGRGDPQTQDVGAIGFHDILGRQYVALGFRHLLLALLIEDEAVRQNDVVGRAATRPARFEQRRLEPAAMLVGALEVHHPVAAAVMGPSDTREAREGLGVFQRERVRRAGVEPHVEHVVDLLPLGWIVAEVRQEPFARIRRKPCVGAFGGKRRDDCLVDPWIAQDVALGMRSCRRRVIGFGNEHRDRHAPRTLTRHDPIGPPLDHGADAVLAGLGHPIGLGNRRQCGFAEGLGRPTTIRQQRAFDGRCRKRPIHRNEPLRRIAEDDRLL